MIDEKSYERLAYSTLDRVDRAFQDVDPDVVETVVSDGVVKFDFQGRRPAWVLNSQRAARQIWLAAERRAWHFEWRGEDPDDERWVAADSGEELFETLRRLFREHIGVTPDFGG